MRVLGKIGDIQVTYQQEKTRDDGSTYWGERYQIAFESGDDIHLVDTKFIHCQSKDGGIEILKKRGIEVGAQGEMRIRYSFRDWQGKRFRDVELDEFKVLTANGAAPTQEPTAAPAQEPTAEPVQAAPAVEKAKSEDGDLPF